MPVSAPSRTPWAFACVGDPAAGDPVDARATAIAATPIAPARIAPATNERDRRAGSETGWTAATYAGATVA